MVDKIVRYFSDPKYQIGKWLYKRFPDWMPDKWYIETMWRMCMGYNINLKAPKTFNEKLQWLKLYDHNPLYTTLVDKYAVKQWVAEKIGIQYVVPTLAVYDSAEDIDIAKLPNQFVLKCTHDSGSVIICKDKSKFNLNEAKIKLSQAMNVNYYKIAREWPYKNVPHRIIAEPFLGKQKSPNDYKFFCFNGKVKYFKVDFNRFSNHFANYYNRSGELQHFGESAIPTSESIKLTIPKKFLDEMISRAEVLSRDAKFMRVDFYSENENVWFGECTLYPAAGFNPLTNNSMELDWGGNRQIVNKLQAEILLTINSSALMVNRR